MAASQPRRSGGALALLAVRFPIWKMIRLVARQAMTSEVVHPEGAFIFPETHTFLFSNFNL